MGALALPFARVLVADRAGQVPGADRRRRTQSA